mmetsp:Transcript_18034/g.27587  ORF Transcript_18034/g.27587 Transcript_18034/m.27587 type:complete len:291 (+) Transcript_18034:14232-15104(+)
MNSDTTSVTARAACICFCAMRPAKSSSKKVTDWPNVQRCKRDKTNGFTLGCTMIEFDADDSPKRIGRAIRKNPSAPMIRPILPGAKNPSGPNSTVASITRPRISAVPASIAPAAAEKNAASQSAGQAPDKHQRMKAHSVCGGGPSDRWNALIQFEMVTRQPLFSGTRRIGVPRTQNIGHRPPKARHGCRLRQFYHRPAQGFCPFRRWSRAGARWRSPSCPPSCCTAYPESLPQPHCRARLSPRPAQGSARFSGSHGPKSPAGVAHLTASLRAHPLGRHNPCAPVDRRGPG